MKPCRLTRSGRWRGLRQSTADAGSPLRAVEFIKPNNGSSGWSSWLSRIAESKSVQLRVDATNVFNHPNPSNPVLNINSTNPFGYIADKADTRRQFQGVVRFSF